MKFAITLLIAAFALSASAESSPVSPVVSAQRCTNAGRGLTLNLPALTATGLAAPLTINHNARVVFSQAPEGVSSFALQQDGGFSFLASDADGHLAARIETSRDEVGRLVVQIHFRDQGLIGFTCPIAK